MKRFAVLFLAAFLLVAAVAPALAADADEVADGIADDGVFVERGASTTDSEIGALVGAARNDGENLAIVVLSEEPVSGATTFADAIVNRVGRVLVIVIAPESVGYAGTGDVYTVDQLENALDVALDRGGDDGALARNIVETLTGVAVTPPESVTTTTTVAGRSDAGDAGGGGGFLVPVIIVLVLIGGFVWWRSRSASRRTAVSEERLSAARAEVQKRIDDVANDLLDMEDEVRQADNARADRFYNEAGETYREVSEEVASANTPADLIDLSNRLDVAIWQLDTAEAILDGSDLPERPEPRTLEPTPSPERTRPIDTSGLPRSSYDRRSTRRSSYGSGSSMMEMLLQLGTAYAAGRMSGRRRPPRGSGGFLGEGTVRASRRSSPVPGPSSRRSSPSPRPTTRSRGTGGRVRGGRRRRRG